MALFDPTFVESQVPLSDYALAVETGTLFGDGAEELRQHFKETPLARQQAPLDEELACPYQSFKPPCAIVIDDINLFDEHGRGRKDRMFVGEDWSHLNLNAILLRMQPRTRLVHPDRTQMLVGWNAAPD